MNKFKKNPELTNQGNDLMWNWRGWYVAVIKATRSPILKAQCDLIQPLNMFARPNTELRHSLFSCKVNFSVMGFFFLNQSHAKRNVWHYWELYFACLKLAKMLYVIWMWLFKICMIFFKNILERTFFCLCKTAQ